MGVVDEAVEDSVGVGRIADDVVPATDGNLRGDERRAAPLTVGESLGNAEH